MRVACVLVGCLAAAGPAGAEPARTAAAPAAEPAPAAGCGVRVRRSPADLGAAIEARVAALGGCGGTLDVWIVRAEGGLYVIARDALGRVRDRVVADVDIAASLIASWVEVDAALPLAAAVATTAPASAVGFAAASPAAAAPRVDARAGEPAPSAPSASGLGVALVATAGLTTSGMTSTGGSLSIDLARHAGVTVSAALGVSRDIATSYYIVRWDSDFFMETGRWSGAGFVELSRRLALGRWRFTPAARLGGGVTRHEILTARDQAPGVPSEPELLTDVSIDLKIGAGAAIGLRVASRFEVEVVGAWTLSGYTTGGLGTDPTDHAFTAGLGLRHTR